MHTHLLTYVHMHAYINTHAYNIISCLCMHICTESMLFSHYAVYTDFLCGQNLEQKLLLHFIDLKIAFFGQILL